MHSWRTLILPYLDALDIDAEGIAKQYDFSKPWNDPKNRRLIAPVERSGYACPLGYEDGTTQTSYVAVVDDTTLWPGTDTATLDDPIESWPDTIMVVEVQRLGIEWSEPRDITLDELLAALKDKKLNKAACSDTVIRCATASRVLYLDREVDVREMRKLCERKRARRNKAVSPPREPARTTD